MNMRLLEPASNLRTDWTYEFFIQLILKHEKPSPISADHEVKPQKKQIPNGLNEVLAMHKIASKSIARESREDLEARRNVQKILANEVPSINLKTSLHKIFWYRIWFCLVLRGVLNKGYFIEHYTSWRRLSGARYFEVLLSDGNKTIGSKSIPIDVFLLSGFPSKEEIESQIELIEPLISRPLVKNNKKKSVVDIVGRRNLENIKIAVDKAIASGKIAGLVKSIGKNARHKYSGNRKDLYREISRKIGAQTKESMFIRGVSEFVETKAK